MLDSNAAVLYGRGLRAGLPGCLLTRTRTTTEDIWDFQDG